jgi:hypothetical protein
MLFEEVNGHAQGDTDIGTDINKETYRDMDMDKDKDGYRHGLSKFQTSDKGHR